MLINLIAKFFPVNILGNNICPSDSDKNLGVVFDSKFSFSKHVSAVCSSCYYHISDFSRVRCHLSKPIATVLANALVSSRLDYCNSIFYSLHNYDLKRLQSIQNALCCIVCKVPHFSHITPFLRELHWLPIKSRICFKTNLLTFKAIHTNKPPYLKNHLNQFRSNYNTRRSNPDSKVLATINYDRNIYHSYTHLKHSFGYAAPRLWNELPFNVRSSPTLAVFRNRLKTHVFHLAYPP